LGWSSSGFGSEHQEPLDNAPLAQTIKALVSFGKLAQNVR
jgi:hypothetical protein